MINGDHEKQTGMQHPTGKLIYNRYRIVTLLGQGGMSTVYRAWDINLKIPVAIKENLETSSESQQQFGEEARLLARLSHPNLPRVTDYFTIPGEGEYLVMDYIEGFDLEALIDGTVQQPGTSANQVGLDEAMVLPWIIQVCQALDYLHQQQPPVIHRDIKPGNIKITPTNRAVLVDFGIAKRYSPGHSTFSGARAVTPGYSPPEQYGGASTDARSDIYALGATLYHLLTGQQPPESVQRAVTGSPPLTPRNINPNISLAVESTILKAMAVPMDRRFQNALEMGAALNQALAQNDRPDQTGASRANAVIATPVAKPPPTPVEPLPRRPATTPPPPKGFLASNWPLLILGGVLVLFLILFIIRLALNNYNAARLAASMPTSSPTFLSPTSTSPIDSLVIKVAATQTAEALRALTSSPPPPSITPQAAKYPIRFFEDFSDNQNEWFAGIQGDLACWIAGGRYTCQVQQGETANHFQWLSKFTLPDRFSLAADLWPGSERPRGLGDANNGLVFRASDLGRYLFSVRNDGTFRVSSIQTAPANWVDLIPWQASQAIRRGQDNRLEIFGRGSHYDLFINEKYVASFDDDQWVDGHPGLHLFTAPGESPALAEFDNFELGWP